MPTILLNKDMVRELLDIREVIEVVEQAFRDLAQGKGSMPSKAYLVRKVTLIEPSIRAHA